jgi:hypothetical protein
MRLVDIAKNYDLSKTSSELAMDFIFATNQYRVPLSKIRFGRPKALDYRLDIEDDPNTYVKTYVDPNFESRFKNDHGFMYLRLPLSVLTPKPGVEFEAPPYPFTTYSVLAKINAYLGTKLTTTDLVNEVYRDPSKLFSLTANSRSLAWVSGMSLPFTNDLTHARLEETGTARTLESGTIRMMETAEV